MDTPATVLLVEDNDALNEINRRTLEGAGHRVLAALTLAQARAHLAAGSPDVILLDIVLPDGDGIDFCGEIRDATDAHILFLTSKTDHVDRIRGLETGGDDYITKPYKLDEMLARVGAVMRRREMEAAKPPAQQITIGPLTLDTLAGIAYYDGRDLLLKPKEFSVLRLLAGYKGRSIAADKVYEAIWKAPMAGGSGAVWKQVSRLKAKLEEASGGKITIHSARGEGYSLEI